MTPICGSFPNCWCKIRSMHHCAQRIMRTLFAKVGLEGLEWCASTLVLIPTKHLWDELEHQPAPGLFHSHWYPTSLMLFVAEDANLHIHTGTSKSGMEYSKHIWCDCQVSRNRYSIMDIWYLVWLLDPVQFWILLSSFDLSTIDTMNPLVTAAFVSNPVNFWQVYYWVDYRQLRLPVKVKISCWPTQTSVWFLDWFTTGLSLP